ncbi:MAG: AtpZ/AtpI family protein [Firmicutes bacterium]|nr:AtpZ/AtpI family protein [Bacillota bacterium]
MGRNYLDYLRYGNIALSWGITTVVLLAAGVYGGYLLDRKLQSSPLFLIFGSFVAIGISFKSLITEILVLEKMLRAERNQRNLPKSGTGQVEPAEVSEKGHTLGQASGGDEPKEGERQNGSRLG